MVKLIPNFLKPTLQKIYHFAIGIFDKHIAMPPETMDFVGGGSFEQIGQDFKNYFIELGNLQPKDRVLDVGCGIGRMAIPLTNYLSRKGGYYGFDIVKMGIEWCQTHISPKFRNFHFQHSDIYNKLYNPNGNVLPQDFQFPFDNEFFDFVFLTSVFTHMLPLEMENYMREISRVLKKGGTCMITFFLLNEESVNLINSGCSTQNFRYEINGCLTTHESLPEQALAYNEEFIRKLFIKHGLVIAQPISYGRWCKRQNSLDYQDIIIAKRSNLD